MTIMIMIVITTYNTSSAYHVQHVVHHIARRDRSAFKVDRVEIAFILALFYWLKSLTDEFTYQENISLICGVNFSAP